MVPLRADPSHTVADLWDSFRNRVIKRYPSVGNLTVDELDCSDEGGGFGLDLAMNGEDTIDCYWPLDDFSHIHDIKIRWTGETNASKEPQKVKRGGSAGVSRGRESPSPSRPIIELDASPPATKPKEPIASKPPLAPTKPLGANENGGRPQPLVDPQLAAGDSAQRTSTPNANSLDVGEGAETILSFPSPMHRNHPATPATDEDEGEWQVRQLQLLRYTEEEDRDTIVAEESTGWQNLQVSRPKPPIEARSKSRSTSGTSGYAQPRTPSSSPAGATGAAYRNYDSTAAALPPPGRVIEASKEHKSPAKVKFNPQLSFAELEDALLQCQTDWQSARFATLTEERKVWRALEKEGRAYHALCRTTLVEKQVEDELEVLKAKIAPLKEGSPRRSSGSSSTDKAESPVRPRPPSAPTTLSGTPTKSAPSGASTARSSQQQQQQQPARSSLPPIVPRSMNDGPSSPYHVPPPAATQSSSPTRSDSSLPSSPAKKVPEKPQEEQPLPASAADEVSVEFLMALRAIAVAQQAEYGDVICGPEELARKRIMEEHWLTVKRMQIAVEAALEKAEKALVEDEEKARVVLEKTELRKFEMFRSLRDKGIERLKK